MSIMPTRPFIEPSVGEETRQIIEQRLAAVDGNPKQDYMEALEDVVREGRKELSRLEHPVSR